MISRQTLQYPGGESHLLVGEEALARADMLEEWVAGRKVFVVSSREILDLYGDRLSGHVAAAAECIVLEVPDGEAAKNLATAQDLWSRMLREGGKRDSRVIGFGGGSVGDLAGFVAGAFLRGVRVAQIPTTLLAQVDASVGGKTAVDLPEAKNSVGLFHHPDWVVADTSLLSTLPEGELRSGLVEVIKMAALLDPDLLTRVERDLDRLMAGDAAALAPVVAASVSAKAKVVEEDPEEGGRRMVLNYGHTLGHAIEASLGYSGLRHGEAIAYGMLFAHRLAATRGWAVDLGERLSRLFGRMQMPSLPEVDRDEVLALLARDKKARESGVIWVLPETLGKDRRIPLSIDEIRGPLFSFLQDPWG